MGEAAAGIAEIDGERRPGDDRIGIAVDPACLQKAEDKWDVFKRKLDRVFPAYGKNMVLPLPEPEE